MKRLIILKSLNLSRLEQGKNVHLLAENYDDGNIVINLFLRSLKTAPMTPKINIEVSMFVKFASFMILRLDNGGLNWDGLMGDGSVFCETSKFAKAEKPAATNDSS